MTAATESTDALLEWAAGLDGADPLTAALSTDPSPDDVVDRIGLQRLGRVAIITLTNPEQHNSLNRAAWQRITEVADALVADTTVHAVVLRGAGTRATGAGADIKEFPERRMSPATAQDYNEGVAGGLRAVAAIPVPTIAMIQGLAVGGALELSSSCDVRIAAQDARLGMPLGRLGVLASLTEARAVGQHIGTSNLRYLIYSSRLLTADRALGMGLVQDVVAPESLAEAVASLVQEILHSSMPTLRAAKLATDLLGRDITAADTEALSRYAIEVYGGPDLAEGVAAFVAGRRAVFPSQLDALRCLLPETS